MELYYLNTPTDVTYAYMLDKPRKEGVSLARKKYIMYMVNGFFGGLFLAAFFTIGLFSFVSVISLMLTVLCGVLSRRAAKTDAELIQARMKIPDFDDKVVGSYRSDFAIDVLWPHALLRMLNFIDDLEDMRSTLSENQQGEVNRSIKVIKDAYFEMAEKTKKFGTYFPKKDELSRKVVEREFSEVIDTYNSAKKVAEQTISKLALMDAQTEVVPPTLASINLTEREEDLTHTIQALLETDVFSGKKKMLSSGTD